MFQAAILWLLAASAALAFMAGNGHLPSWNIAFGAGCIGAAFAGLLAIRLCVTAQTEMTPALFAALLAFPALAGASAAGLAAGGVTLPELAPRPIANPVPVAIGFFAVLAAVLIAPEAWVRLSPYEPIDPPPSRPGEPGGPDWPYRGPWATAIVGAIAYEPGGDARRSVREYARSAEGTERP